MQRFLCDNLAQQFFNFGVNIVRFTADYTAKKFVQLGDKACWVCGLIMFENLCKELIVCFPVGHVVSAAQRIAHCVHSAGACICKADACKVRCNKKFFQQVKAVVFAFFHNFLKAFDNHFHSLLCKHSCVKVCSWGNIAFNCVDKGVDCACCKKVVWQFCQQVRDDDCIVREDGRVSKTNLCAHIHKLSNGNAAHLAACAAGCWHSDNRQNLFKRDFSLIVVCSIAVSAQHKDFCHIDNSTAADCDNAVAVSFAEIFQHCVYHTVGRFALAVVAFEVNLCLKVHTCKVFVVDCFCGKDKVLFANVKFFYKLGTVCILMHLSYVLEHFHYRYTPLKFTNI